MDELFLKLQSSAALTLEELESMQEAFDEKNEELRGKITMVKDEAKKAALQAERTKVQEAIVAVDAKIEEVKKRESGLSAYREEDEKESGLSAYREDEKESGLSAYREEDAKDEGGKSKAKAEPAKREETPAKKVDYGQLAYQYWSAFKDYRETGNTDKREIAEKIFAEASMGVEQGNRDAMVALAQILYNDSGGDVKCRRLLEMAIEKNESYGYLYMAYLLSAGYGGVKKGEGKALAYLDRAADRGALKAVLLKAEAYGGTRPNYTPSLIPLNNLDNILYRLLSEKLPRDMGKAANFYKRWLEAQYGDDKQTSLYYYNLLKYVECGIAAGIEEVQGADRLKEIITPLLEDEGSAYKEQARTIYANVLCEEKRFREAVTLWLKGGTLEDIRHILEHYDAIVKSGDGEALDAILAEKMNDTSRDQEKLDIKGMILTWKGERCGEDKAAAFGYYCKAAAAGWKEAIEIRERMWRGYFGQATASNRFLDAILLFKTSGELGNADAYRYLGDFYQEDWPGCPHDYQKALDAYKRGLAGTMRDECEKQARKLAGWVEMDKMFADAIKLIGSTTKMHRDDGLSIIKQLAEKNFPPAMEYMNKQKK